MFGGIVSCDQDSLSSECAPTEFEHQWTHDRRTSNSGDVTRSVLRAAISLSDVSGQNSA